MTNVRKMLQMNITISQKVLFWHCLELLTLIVVRGQIQHVFRLLTNENIIFMSINC